MRDARVDEVEAGKCMAGKERWKKLMEKFLCHERTKNAPSQERSFEETSLNARQGACKTLGWDFEVVGQVMHGRRGKET